MNLNKVIILGNLTRDPEIKSLPSGQYVANFSVATNRFFYNKNKEKQKQTEFHNVVAFGRNAEIAQQYLKKGSQVLIEGRLQTRTWQDSSGNNRSRTEIITERLQLGPKTQDSEFTKQQPSKENKHIPEEEIPIIEDEDEIDVNDIPL